MNPIDFVTVGVSGGRPEAQVGRARPEAEGIETGRHADDAGAREAGLGLTNGVRLLAGAPFVAAATGPLEPAGPAPGHPARGWVVTVAAGPVAVLVLLVTLPLVLTAARIIGW